MVVLILFLFVLQTGLEKNLFGNHPVALSPTESRGPPPAFASDPLVSSSGDTHNNKSSLNSIANTESNLGEGFSATTGNGSSKNNIADIVEIEMPGSEGNFVKSSSPSGVRASCLLMFHCKMISQHMIDFFQFVLIPFCFLFSIAIQPVATTRKGALNYDRQNSEISYYADDEDGNRKKYVRRGKLHAF